MMKESRMQDFLQEVSFDYEALDEATRTYVLRKTDETHGLMKRTAENIIKIGQNLLAVQKSLRAANDRKNGLFLSWLQAEFSMSQTAAYRFMQVATKFADKKLPNLGSIAPSVLYELASASDKVIEQVESGQIPPTVGAIKEVKEAERLAKEAEQQARAEVQAAQQQLFHMQEMSCEQQVTIERLNRDIKVLQEQITTLSTPEVRIKEVEKPIVPPEVTSQLEALHQQVQQLTQQRDALTKQVMQLGEEARAAALKHSEGEQERRIHLNWYKATSAFQASIRTILSQWPSPLDVEAFEADDWQRLAQTKELARRFLKECEALTGGSGRMIIEGLTLSAEEAKPKQRTQ
jgi:hypothetical protein